jgi:hypothetical protein
LATTSTATSAPSLASLSATLLLRFALALLLVAGQVGNSQPLGQVDLSANSVGQVADHENVLNVVVEIMLDLRRINLGGERQSVEKVLANSVVGFLILIQNPVNPLTRSIEKADGLLN